MDFSAIKTLIEQNIRTNNNEDITGSVLQNVLLGIIETLGDDAINDLITALGQEVTNRQNAVQDEADARVAAINDVLGLLRDEVQARLNADADEHQRAEAAFDDLDMIDAAGVDVRKESINLTLRKNDGSDEDPDWRTLCSILLPSVSYDRAGLMSVDLRNKLLYLMNGGYLFQGVAVPASNPGTPHASCFYLATKSGTYTNFHNADDDPIVIEHDAIYVLTYDAVENSYWEWNKVTDFGDGVFDISMYNLTEGQPTAYADLSAALGTNGANVPAAFRKGGMSIKFVHTSDKNYVQYRLPKNQWSAIVKDWIPDNQYLISLNNNLLNSAVSELYIYKKDGTTIDNTLRFGLTNIVIGTNNRRVVNIFARINGTNTIILDADTLRGEDLSGTIIELKEKNESGYLGYIVVNWNYVTATINEQSYFNNNRILSVFFNPIIESFLETKKEIADLKDEIETRVSLFKQPLSDVKYINAQIIELYLKGEGVAPSNVYKLMNTYIYNYRYAFNITDGNNNIVCSFDSTNILYPDSEHEKLRNGVLLLTEKNNSGISGYAVIDFNKVTSSNYNATLNSDRITTLSVNPIIKGYLEDISVTASIDNKIADVISSNFISTNSSILRSTVSELYIYKKDGTQIDNSTNFGLGNLAVIGTRRAINIGIKDSGGNETLILDADTARGEDLSGTIITLKEKNSSGYGGYMVLAKNVNEYQQTINGAYSFNNAVILNKNCSPLICSYLDSLAVNDSSIALRKEITDKIASCAKSTVVEEIGMAKQGTWVDANAQGFLPTNTAAQNVSAMNTLLANGGVIIVEQPGVYEVDSPMLIHSNTTLLFAPGVVFSKVADGYLFINQAAYNFATTGYDENIRVIGFKLNTNGRSSGGNIDGLRGFLTFFHAKNVYISDVNCYYYKAHGFFMHLCDWQNIEICNIKVYGDKDCIHLGRGKKAYIHNCVICSVDDAIALNAWDFVESNPETGDIEDVKIENIVELPMYYNTASAYSLSTGCAFSIRMLNGCWLNWTSGMTVQHSTRVVYDGALYRCTNLSNTTATSNVTPDTAINTINIDGILWRKETSPAVLGCCVKNVYVSNYVTYQKKSEGNFCLSNGINVVDHKSWVEGATWIPNENLHFSNIECYGDTPAPFLVQEDVKDAIIVDSIFDDTVISKGLFYFKEMFGINPSEFTVPTFNLVNNMHKLGEDGIYKLSAVNVSGRRDSANIYTTDEKYSQNLITTFKTDDTIVTEQDKIYVV